MNEQLTFGSWLKERRKQFDLTQFDLADRVGCSEDTIQKIERGERRPSKQIAQRLAEFLHVSPDEREAFVAAARDGRPPDATAADRQAFATRSSPASPTNLPTPLTPLIGREEAVADARSYLLDGVRLLTLTGAPGIGKTRLSLQVASELLPEFEDGVYLAELAPITNPDLVAPTIAGVLGLREMAQQTIVEVVKQFLGGSGAGDSGSGKRILLVLDNFEQVLDAAPMVVELLSGCPKLKVLVTSREALHVVGEQQFPVSPMRMPDLSRLPDWQQLLEYPAVELFVQRAAAIDPDFELTAENFRDVAEICARLEGLPLAIELATARIKVFSTQALLSKLESRLRALTGRTAALPHRQQTLRNAIEWSYDLLTDEEKRLFRRLAVFVGGRTIEAVEEVCNSDGSLGLEVVDGLLSLVDKSLLRRDRGAGGEPRFVMLEMIHEYAREKLHESGEAESLRREHALYFMRLAEAAEPLLVRKEQQEWLERLDDEYDNIRAVAQWAKEGGKAGDLEAVEVGLRMEAPLWRFSFVRGHVLERQQALIGLLDSHARLAQAKVDAESMQGEQGVAVWSGIAESNQATASVKYRANALKAVGVLLFMQGDLAAARLAVEDSLLLSRNIGDRIAIANSLTILGWIIHQQRDFTSARLLMEEALNLNRELGNLVGVGVNIHNLGMVAFAQGDYATARPLLEETLAQARENGHKEGIATSMVTLGLLAYEQGDYGSASATYKEGLELHRELGNKRGVSTALLGLGLIAVSTGQSEMGVRLLGATEALIEEVGIILEKEERSPYDRALSTAREQMGEEAFSRAWQLGRVMSTEQAIEYALRSEQS